MLKKVIAVTLVLLLMFPNYAKSSARLSASQKSRVNTIVDVCTEHWEEYGVLPSTCITQAFVESTLGKYCSGNNLWGICSGAVSYSSLEEGVIGYCKVINNGYYKNAPFKKNTKEQLRAILDGGYCQPEGSYYSDACWLIDNYNLTKYDKKLFKKLKEKRQRKLKKKRQKMLEEKRKKKFTCIYKENKEDFKCIVDTTIIPKNETIACYHNNERVILSEVKSGNVKGNFIITDNSLLDGLKVYVELTGAKG